jgi:hypothetical protein
MVKTCFSKLAYFLKGGDPKDLKKFGGLLKKDDHFKPMVGRTKY